MVKKNYYYDYLSEKKDGSLSKRKYSRDFKTLAEAKKSAMMRYRQGKLIQATFWDKSNMIGHKIVGGLDTSGHLKPAKYS